MSNKVRSFGAGGRLVIGATLLAGLGGYAITTLMARTLSVNYVEFAVFWALLYLAVGSFSGIQQEVSRGVSQRNIPALHPAGVKLLGLALQLAGIVALITSVFFLFWGSVIFPNQASTLSIAVVVGATLSVFLGVVAGALYGTHSWGPLAVLILADVFFRLGLLAIVSSVTKDVGILAWVCSVPYVLALVCVIPMAKKAVNFSTTLDVNLAQAYRNISRTVLASSATALLVSGFPALLVLSEGSGFQSRNLSALIFALTITRAPLVVGILALQSLLVVFFRDYTGRKAILLLKFSFAIVLAGLLISAGAFAIGDQVLTSLAGPEFYLSSTYLFFLTFSSVPTALLGLTGAATLARRFHSTYSLAWVSAAAISTVSLFIPGSLETRIILALTVGPLVGVVINVFALVLRRNNS